ncbi:Beige 1 [Venturia inaequalis]|nr:Beige 1 [Venturia inaequalis]
MLFLICYNKDKPLTGSILALTNIYTDRVLGLIKI